jgi:anti-sigma-K factor RskA
MSYLYGELSPAARRDADRHLQGCAECRQRVDQWRGTMGLLEADHATLALPRRTERTVFAGTVVRWALAASLVLLAGFIAGRTTGLSGADVERQIAAAREQITAELRQRHEEDLKAMAAATVAATAEQNRNFLTEFSRQFNAARSEERRDWIAALDSLNRQHADDLAAVRTGLAALARKTGAGFQQAESQLNLLASYLPAGSEPGGAFDSSLPKEKP